MSGFSSMKRLAVYLYSPLDGMLVHRWVTPSIKFSGTHLHTWVERGTMRVSSKCFGQERNRMSPARSRTRTTRSAGERTNHETTAPPPYKRVTTHRLSDFPHLHRFLFSNQKKRYKSCKVVTKANQGSFCYVTSLPIDNRVVCSILKIEMLPTSRVVDRFSSWIKKTRMFSPLLLLTSEYSHERRRGKQPVKGKKYH